LEVRKAKKFESFFDFCERGDSRTTNKKVVESLIKCGAMDAFGFKRAAMVLSLNKLLEKSTKKEDASQMVFFEIATKKEQTMPEVEEWPTAQILEFEKALLGIYVTTHPLCAFTNSLKYLNRQKINSFYEDDPKSQEVLICGIVDKVKLMTTRKGDRMAFIRIEDETGNVEALIFPKLYEAEGARLVEKSIVVMRGRLEAKEKVPKILASTITPIESFYNNIERVDISIDREKTPIGKLKNIFADNKGTTPVVFKLRGGKFEGVKIKTAQDYALALSETTLAQIGELVGEDNLTLTFKNIVEEPRRSYPTNSNKTFKE
jgi:DNA polymerase-3 subunit alpha